MKKFFGINLNIMLLFMMPIIGYGQQQPMFSQYMFNAFAINPAYAGSTGALSLTALSRHQWMDIEGAPSTQTFSAHSPVKNERIGLGMLIMRDNIGITNQLATNFAYTYKIPMGKGLLSSGLQASFHQYKISYSNLHIDGDVAFGPDDVSRINPNFGAGAYYSTPLFYAGFSVPQIMTMKQENTDLNRNFNLSRHYFFTSGYVFTLNQDLKLKPNILINAVEGAPLSIDLNSNLLIRNVIWVGASFRGLKSLGLLLDLQVMDQFRVGYAYDLPSFSINHGMNSSSHEFMLNYIFSFSKNKSLSPRYF